MFVTLSLHNLLSFLCVVLQGTDTEGHLPVKRSVRAKSRRAAQRVAMATTALPSCCVTLALSPTLLLHTFIYFVISLSFMPFEPLSLLPVNRRLFVYGAVNKTKYFLYKHQQMLKEVLDFD
jgi:hypothetical protein